MVLYDYIPMGIWVLTIVHFYIIYILSIYRSLERIFIPYSLYIFLAYFGGGEIVRSAEINCNWRLNWASLKIWIVLRRNLQVEGTGWCFWTELSGSSIHWRTRNASTSLHTPSHAHTHTHNRRTWEHDLKNHND